MFSTLLIRCDERETDVCVFVYERERERGKGGGSSTVVMMINERNTRMPGPRRDLEGE